MRIYVAAKFEQAAKARALMNLLEQDGHFITYDWTDHFLANNGIAGGADEQELTRQAGADRKGVERCEAIVMILHPRCKGAWVEVGMAIGAAPTGRRVILVDDADVVGDASCVFEHCADVFRVGTVSAARALLKQWEDEWDDVATSPGAAR